MKYKLLKQFDKESIPVWAIFDMWDKEFVTLDFDDSKISIAWLMKEWYIEPVVEKKTYDDLKKWDEVWYIFTGKWIDCDYFTPWDERSEVFFTREEAEDEHKRREWAFRKDKFIPKYDELYYFPRQDWIPDSWGNTETAGDFMIINAWLAFRSAEDCQEAIDKHDLIRLFYTIR